MDALSRLLALYPMRTALDIRCQFGAPWAISEDAAGPGIAPYHLIVSGSGWNRLFVRVRDRNCLAPDCNA